MHETVSRDMGCRDVDATQETTLHVTLLEERLRVLVHMQNDRNRHNHMQHKQIDKCPICGNIRDTNDRN